MPTATKKARKTRVLTKDDHAQIQSRCNIKGDENYAAVLQRGKGFSQWSIHVFTREPTLPEINKYEQTASRVEFKGQKAKIEGSQIQAGVSLYNTLIDRAYDVLIGLRSVDTLNTSEARQRVPPLVKREAVVDMIGGIYSSSRMEEIEGAGEDDEDPADDDLEEHTSGESED